MEKIDWFEDVFWFTEVVLSDILKESPGKIYNRFHSLKEIRDLKSLYGSKDFDDKIQDYDSKTKIIY